MAIPDVTDNDGGALRLPFRRTLGAFPSAGLLRLWRSVRGLDPQFQLPWLLLCWWFCGHNRAQNNAGTEQQAGTGSSRLDQHKNQP